MKDRRYLDQLAEFFKARPNQLIDGLALQQIAGAYAWRSRVSDCRTILGMDIRNEQRREGKRVISEYRYVPPAPVTLEGWPSDGLTIVDEARS